MRYIEITARNIIWTSHEDKLIKDMVDYCHNENAKRWVRGQFRKWLINNYENVFKITRPREDYPEYINNAIGSDDPPYAIDWYDSEVWYHWLDYLNTLLPTKDLTRLSVDGLKLAVEKWEKSFHSKKKNLLGNTKKILDYGEYTWYQLLDATALEYESDKMNHCVSSYSNKVKLGESKIYSLRDNKQIPHVTVEVFKNTLIQIKGNSNKQIKNIYKSAVLDLIEKIKPELKKIDDITRNGWAIHNNKLMSLEDVPCDYVLDVTEFKYLLKKGNVSDRIIDGHYSKRPISLSGINISGSNKRISNCTFKNIRISIENSNVVFKDCTFGVVALKNSTCNFDTCKIFLLSVGNCQCNIDNCEIKRLDSMYNKITIKDVKESNNFFEFEGDEIKTFGDMKCTILDMTNCTWKVLPDLLEVEKLLIVKSKIGKLPKLKIPKTGSLILRGVNLSSIPPLKISTIYLEDVPLIKLPAGIEVEELEIKKCTTLRLLPDNLVVKALFGTNKHITKKDIRKLKGCQNCKIVE